MNRIKQISASCGEVHNTSDLAMRENFISFVVEGSAWLGLIAGIRVEDHSCFTSLKLRNNKIITLNMMRLLLALNVRRDYY